MGEIVTFTLEKTGKSDLNPVIKANIIDMGTRGYLVSPGRKCYGGHNITLVFLPEMRNLNLIMRKHWNVLQSFEVSRSGSKEALRSYSRLKDTKGSRLEAAKHNDDLGLYPNQGKNSCIQDLWDNWWDLNMDYELENSINVKLYQC